MENIDPPARFLLNQFLRGEVSLPHVHLYVTLRVVAEEMATTQIFGPITYATLFMHATMGDVLSRFYNRSARGDNDVEGKELILRYANIYWDRMEER